MNPDLNTAIDMIDAVIRAARAEAFKAVLAMCEEHILNVDRPEASAIRRLAEDICTLAEQDALKS